MLTLTAQVDDLTGTAPATAGDEPSSFPTREAWLVAAVDLLRGSIFAPAGYTAPPIRVSVGWPGGRTRNRAKVIGQCWAARATRDGIAQVFVSPVLDDAVLVLDVLTHELIHAIDDGVNGHRPPFGKIARAVGLEGPLTATHAGPELLPRLRDLARYLGAYPHSAIATNAEGTDTPKKQTTRMLKVECAKGSGYTVRTTRKWLDEYGAPFCPCHTERMLEA